MTAIQYLPIDGLKDDEQKHVNKMWEQLLKHAPNNRLRTAYYEFEHNLRRASQIIPPQYQRLVEVLGWTGKAVDALGMRCSLEGFASASDLDSYGLRDLERKNRFKAKMKTGMYASLVHGTAFIITDPILHSGEDVATVTVGDALSTTGLFRTGTRELEWALAVNEWDDGPTQLAGTPKTVTLYTPKTVLVCERHAGRLRVEEEWDHPFGMPVEVVAYKPFIRDFGSSRITRALMGLQDRAVASVGRMEAHMDIYSIPDFWVIGAGMEVFAGEDGAFNPWRVMMGRLKAIPDDDDLIAGGSEYSAAARVDVKQFPAATPDPHMAALNVYAKMFAREADLPDASLAITDVANPASADSYVESREAIIAAAEGATDDWSLPITRALVRALAVTNDDPRLLDELDDTEPHWRSPMYTSRAAAADAGGKQLAAGPSWLRETNVGLELIGLTPSQIRRALQEKEAAQAVLDAKTPSFASTQGTERVPGLVY